MDVLVAFNCMSATTSTAGPIRQAYQFSEYRSALHSDSLPTNALARWLIAPAAAVGPAIARQLVIGLYASWPIFLGGVINSVAVAVLAASRHPTRPFLLWAGIELAIALCRVLVVALGHRTIRLDRKTPITIAVLLACAWAASIGFGAFLSIWSEDWVLSTIVALSTTGMVSGICLRNFGTPRLVAVMMCLSLIPCAVAALLASEPMLLIVSIQLPVYMLTIGAAAFRMNRMMVGRMTAQEALERSEAFNRSILESSPDYTLLLDEDGQIVFCNTPQQGPTSSSTVIGVPWLDILPAGSRTEGQLALRLAGAGDIARMTVAHDDPNGRRWFDLAVSRVSGGSGETLIVARDITHQKSTEEQAVWMANHDPLTRLPNRIVLQGRLDTLANNARRSDGCALLVLDVDNFKLINDTLGHDAGDALLCAVADRLRNAVRSEDLVARLGGDEFAVVTDARSDEEISIAGDRILQALHEPFVHDGRLIECNASIGASLWPRDGSERSELMKAADVALYSAKSGGRGQLKIFASALRNEFQTRHSMISLAKRALSSDDILPYYQPKVRLCDGEIMGFEALLRWRDSANRLQPPERLKAAFEDPLLSAAISNRMIERTLADMRRWLDQGLDLGQVAINVAAAEFRSNRFAEKLLEKLEARKIPPHCLQVEVTETVFLGRGAEYVGRALRRLKRSGVTIALDDFGTGYASLAHLMQFPVDALKIDQSFIRGIGKTDEAEAITRAIVNLGQSLDIEIIAEGVETADQEAHLIGLGCQAAQGYLYSKAVPGESVGALLSTPLAKSA